MRISDWSSDVCSSDLGQGALETKAEPMASHRRPDDPRNEPIYRAIIAVLAASVLAGAVLALAGEALFGSRALATAGFGLAVVCGVFYKSEEHTSELQSLMRISYAVFCLKKKKRNVNTKILIDTDH